MYLSFEYINRDIRRTGQRAITLEEIQDGGKTVTVTIEEIMIGGGVVELTQQSRIAQQCFGKTEQGQEIRFENGSTYVESDAL